MSNRKNTHDVMPKPPKAKPEDKPGLVPKDRIPILDHLGQTRGHCGPRMTAAGVSSRFLGGRDVTLQKIDGRDCWKATRDHLTKRGLVS